MNVIIVIREKLRINVTGLDPNGPPELAPASFNVVPDSLTSGQTFEVEYDITNRGTGAAQNFIPAGFYLFKEDYLQEHSDIVQTDVPRIYPLQTFADDTEAVSIDGKSNLGQQTASLELPNADEWQGFSEGSGDYYVGLFADPADSVKESNETNNSLTESLIDYEKVNITVAGGSSSAPGDTQATDELVAGIEIPSEFIPETTEVI